MIGTQDYSIYHVEMIRHSASAIIIFARNPHTNEQVVLKVLREMNDERYDLSTIEKRQQCQIEAMDCNPKFTSDIYFGLAHIRETLEELERNMRTLEEIGVGPVLKDPEKPEYLLEKKEYALLMRLLPENRRLDILLEANCSYKSDEPIPSYLLLLLKRICTIHTDQTVFPTIVLESEDHQWGSIEQLRKKLQENLAWLEKALAQKPDLSDLPDTYNRLKENLSPVLNMKKYRAIFERRLDENCIKHCHGDLKTDNIWIEADSPQCNERPETCVRILDCIDFNPLFCMIDTLSDIALLIVDIQARTDNLELANAIIDEYLRNSGEDEEAARYLLAYYLVEKAIIGTVNSFIDDKNEKLGTSYTRVVHQRQDELINRIRHLEK
jgi:aminoglycoside phosphotransferase family enzyme